MNSSHKINTSSFLNRTWTVLDLKSILKDMLQLAKYKVENLISIKTNNKLQNVQDCCHPCIPCWW